MPDQFAQMWKKAKEEFEGKKPGEKILFWTRKSGVRETAIGLDKALANIDLANLKPLGTALDAFEFAKETYIKTLDAAMKEKGATVRSKSQCQKLADTLKQMKKAFEQSSDDCKKVALNKAIKKLVTKKGVPEDNVIDNCLFWFQKGSITSTPSLPFATMHKIALVAKEAKKQAEAIKKLVLPEIKKYCDIFDKSKWEDLPCDQELKDERSRLANLYKLYRQVNEGDIDTIIAATEVNATIWHKKGIDDFNAYRKTIIDLMNNDELSRATQSKEKLIGDSFKEVNKALDVYVDGLHQQLQTLKAHALQIGVDNGPILALVENLNKHKSFVSQTPGEDVRKWLSAISQGMGAAIKPLENFKL